MSQNVDDLLEGDLSLDDIQDDETFSGLDVQAMNIAAGQAVTEAVRTTLGPQGMDKMVVDASGMGMVTNNGASILKEIDTIHPAADLMVEVASTQEDEVGDGTTVSVILAGGLLEKAAELLNRGLHTTTIVDGYNRAAARVLETFPDHAIEVDTDDEETLRRIANTAITGKAADQAGDVVSRLTVDAALGVTTDGVVDIDAIQFEKNTGGRMGDSELIEGVLVDRGRAHEEIAYAIEDATVALVNEDLQPDVSHTEMEVGITEPEEYEEILADERERLREITESLVDAGADAVISSQHIDAEVLSDMMDAGLYVVHNLNTSDAEILAKTTGARVLEEPRDATPEDMGHAGYVGETIMGGNVMTIVRNGTESEAVTIVLRGGTRTVLDEVHRAMEDALHSIQVTLRDGKVLPGGGAAEMAAATDLYEFAREIDSREQLAVEAFADVLEVVPFLLAQNSGSPPVDALVELRNVHEDGDLTAGIDGYTGEVTDMLEEGVVDPLGVKSRAVETAAEAATMILRVDDFLPTAESEIEKTGWQGGDIDQELVDYDSRSKSM